MLVAAVSVLCAIAVAAFLVGLHRVSEAIDQEHQLYRRQSQFVRSIVSMQREMALLQNPQKAGRPSRIEGDLQEMGELWGDFCDEFKNLSADESLWSDLEEEWEQLSVVRAAVKKHSKNESTDNEVDQIWTQLSGSLEHFEVELNATCDGIRDTLYFRRRTSLWLMFGGTFVVALALFLSFSLFITVVSDIASESFKPENLRQEVKECISGNQFKCRIKMLVPLDKRDACTGEWSLEMKRVMPERRTHVCFECVVRNNDVKIRLWGRRYKWAGYVKSFQRIVLPAFAEATWRALSRMYNNGLSTPAPIARKRIKAGPFKVGQLLLMEHVGEVRSVKEFLKCDFCLLCENEQDNVVKSLIDFIQSLHDLGIYGVKPRYLHGKHLASGEAGRQFYLFDLDKVVIWDSAPSIIDRWLRHKDYKRLMKRVEPLVSQARLERIQKWRKR